MENITGTIVDFFRLLRDNGFTVGVKETLDSLSALNIVKITDRASLKSALRSIVSTSKEEFELFDSLFEQFWQNLLLSFPHSVTQNVIPSITTPEGRFHQPIPDTQTEDQSQTITSGASTVERLKKTDFSKISATDCISALEENECANDQKVAFIWKKWSC
jgi:uncharacterized protein with von Willebrand factor type A (vWA) domain